MSPAEFEALVAEALDGIPDEFARYLENVSVVVEDEPDEEGLYGLYQGIPLSERSHDFAAALPDRISIYRGPLVRDFRSRAQIRRQIRLEVPVGEIELAKLRGDHAVACVGEHVEVRVRESVLQRNSVEPCALRPGARALGIEEGTIPESRARG